MLVADADGTVVETLAEPGQVVAPGRRGESWRMRAARSDDQPAGDHATRHRIAGAGQALRRRPPLAGALRQLSDAADPGDPNLRGALRPRRRGRAGAAGGHRHRSGRRSTEAATHARSRSARSTTTASRPASGSSRRTSSVSFRPVRIAGSARRPPSSAAASAVGRAFVALGAHLLHEGERVRVVDGRWPRQMTGFNLSALAVRERAVTLFLIIAVAMAGGFAFLKLGRAEDPAFTVKVMTVRRPGRAPPPRRCRITSPSRWRSACRSCAGTTASRPSRGPASPS